MSAIQTLKEAESPPKIEPVVNDFSITVATINGSGSQTSNLTMLRALFKMGIPVSGKNIFPSNIQGLPTWYTIRISKDGYLARRNRQEIVVAMNINTFAQDLAQVESGGSFYYPDHFNLAVEREDISKYPLPVKALARASDAPPKLRDYVANMVYVGALTHMLGMDMDHIYQALDFHFKGKTIPIDMNFNVVQAAVEWAAENLEKRDPFRVEPMDATRDYILTDGNTAGALGAIYGGIQFASWYPITPASSLPEALSSYLPTLRKDPETGKNTFAVVQAEDELAAIGMAIGAGWGGLRSMTSTSGPGISLMTEFAGYAYFAEIPVVIWDIQRVGPSTGMPTRTQQGDITQVRFLGHGDTEQVILFPANGNECFQMGWKAFDIAERLQAPVFILSDLDLGMNQWMTEPFKYPDTPMDRGKVLWEEDLEELKGQWARYLDVDGDGITYRTLPGNRHPRSAYFTRGTGHNVHARYSESPDDWLKNMERLHKKYEGARALLPEPVVKTREKASVGIVSIGSADAAVLEACDLLAKEDFPTDYLRVRGIPFHESVRSFIEEHERLYVVELNRDGQLHQLLTLEVPDLATRLISISFSDGMPLTARWIMNAIQAKEGMPHV